jgi:hypothetical protein
MIMAQYEGLPSVNMNPAAHMGSGWRAAIGKPLTNHAITKRMKEGYYGELAKQVALGKCKANGFIDRCECGETRGVEHRSFSYLPKAGFYCPACLERHRGGRPRERQHGKPPRDLSEFV